MVTQFDKDNVTKSFEDDYWLLDSGVSHHIIPSFDQIMHCVPYTSSKFIVLGNDSDNKMFVEFYPNGLCVKDF